MLWKCPPPHLIAEKLRIFLLEIVPKFNTFIYSCPCKIGVYYWQLLHSVSIHTCCLVWSKAHLCHAVIIDAHTKLSTPVPLNKTVFFIFDKLYLLQFWFQHTAEKKILLCITFMKFIKMTPNVMLPYLKTTPKTNQYFENDPPANWPTPTQR